MVLVAMFVVLVVFDRGPAVILDKKYVVVVWKRGCVECYFFLSAVGWEKRSCGGKQLAKKLKKG